MAMTVTAEKVSIPSATDAYGYLSEQRQMAASQRTIVVVADRTEAETIAANMATDGRAVSDANPLHVYRLDTQRLETKIAAGWGGPPAGPLYVTNYTQVSGAIGAKAVVMNINNVTLTAGRTYQIRVAGNYYSSGTGSTFVFTIGTCSTADAANNSTGITQLATSADHAMQGNEGRRFEVSTFYKPASTVTTQIKFLMERVTGGDGGFVQGAADNPVQLAIIDCGVTPSWT